MDLCLLKCEVTGHDYGTGKQLDTSMIQLGGEKIQPLSSADCYKYLGVRLSLDGLTSKERDYIMQACRKAVNALKWHAYTAEQALEVVDMCVKPVFGYSCPLTQWNRRELELLEQQWVSVTKRAWGLTPGHNSAPFRLPPELGGV